MFPGVEMKIEPRSNCGNKKDKRSLGLRLSDIMSGVESVHLAGPAAGTVEVRQVTSDSRLACDGALFFAVPGTKHDGHDFALAAARAGCTGIILERWVEGLEAFEHCAVLRVPRARAALALCASNLHGRPGTRLPLVGVTGTNGKTTVSWLLAEIAEREGRSIGLFGTIGVRRAGALAEATHTTPAPERLQELLAELLDGGGELAIMEVSSHALDQERVLGCRFVAAAFTGLSRDHLDYHPDLEHYFSSKTRLFTEHLEDGANALVFIDEPYGQRLLDLLATEGRVTPISVSILPARDGSPQPFPPSAVVARDVKLSLSGVEAKIGLFDGTRCRVSSSLVGPHNLANIAVAAGLARALGFEPEAIGRCLSACSGVPGRLERIPDSHENEEDEGRHLFVDYAHTDDALRRMIGTLKGLAPADKRVLVVAGCGGDRDRGKRPLMGKAASTADVAIITSDNPRHEDPEEIIREMLPGLAGSRYVVETDRKAAIEAAVAMARHGDVVLVAGKGHEVAQLVGSESRAFDDRAVSREALEHVAPGTRRIPSVVSDAGPSSFG